MSESDFERGFADGFERGFFASRKSEDRIEIVPKGPRAPSISGIMGEWRSYASASGCNLLIDFYTDCLCVEKSRFKASLFTRAEIEDGIYHPEEMIGRLKVFSENPLEFDGCSVRRPK